MPSIPTYQRQFLPQGDLVGARANTNVAPDDAIGRAMQGIGQQGVGLANTMMQVEARDKREADKKLEEFGAEQSRTLLSRGDTHWQERTTVLAQGWKVGGDDLRKTLGTEYDKWVSENEQKLPTDASKSFFRQHAESQKSRLQMGMFTHMEKATEAKREVDNEIDLQEDEKTVTGNPDRFDEVFKRSVEPMIATSKDEARTIKEAHIIKQRLSWAAEMGKMKRDPAGYYRERFGSMMPAGTPGATAPAAGGGFDAVMESVFRHEGGYNAKDGGNGAPVNFGINQGHNPDIDVKNLTKAEAAKLYKTRYWDKIGGDTLPPALQATAMDAAVNQGPANAQKWIDASGGDVVKFNTLRRAHYERLLEKPENAKYRGAWMRRMAEAESGKRGPAAAPGAPPGDGVSYAEAPKPPATFTNLQQDKQDDLRRMNETMLRQQTAVLHSQMEQTLRDATAMQSDGKVAPDIPETAFVEAYGPDGIRRSKEFQNGQAMATDIGSYLTMTPEQIKTSLQTSQSAVDGVVAAGGDGYQSADARQQLRVRAAESVVKMQQADPQAYAVRAGISGAKPLDFSNMELFSKEIAGRTATAAMMRDKYQAPYTLLTNQEAAQMGKVMSKFPAAARVDYLNAIRRSVSDPVAYRSVIAQIAADSPVTAVAGSILAKDADMKVPGGWLGTDMAMNPKAVATTILQGESILNPDKSAKKEDGRGGNFPMPKTAEMETAFANYVGTAFRGDPDGYKAAFQAYRAYYAGKASETGTLSEVLNDKFSDEALHGVTGGVSDFHGNGQVMKPWGMSDGEFESRVRTGYEVAMQKAGYTGTSMDQFKSYGLQALRGNQYLLTNGTTRLTDKQGNPIIIDASPDNSAAKIPQTRVSPREVTGKVQ